MCSPPILVYRVRLTIQWYNNQPHSHKDRLPPILWGKLIVLKKSAAKTVVTPRTGTTQ